MPETALRQQSSAAPLGPMLPYLVGETLETAELRYAPNLWCALTAFETLWDHVWSVELVTAEGVQ